MTEFPSSLRLLEAELQFSFAEAAATASFVPLAKRVSADVCFYVFGRDDSDGDGAFSAHLWIAPIDFPDDRLDSLGIGFKILLGETYDYEDSFSEAVIGRTSLLVRNVQGIVKAVQDELLSPLFSTPRLASYRAESSAFRVIRRLAETEGDSLWTAALHAAAAVIDGTSDYDELETLCVSLAKQALESEPPLAFAHQRHFGGDANLLGSSLAGRMYIETLCPWNDST